MNQWIHKSMNQWFNNLNQGTNESMNQRNMLPTSSSKSAPILSAFLILRCKSNSRYSLVHILPASSPNSAPIPSDFCNFYVRSISRYSLVRILLTYLPKCSKHASFFLTFWSANRALATVWCTFCRPHLPKVLRAFHCKSSARNSRVRFFMMMWLTWWWKCWPWQSCATRKFSN